MVYEEIVSWACEHEPKWGECVIFLELDVPGSRDFNARNIDFVIAFSDRVAVVEVKNHRSFKSAQGVLQKSLRQCCDSFDLLSTHLAGAVDDRATRPFLYIPDLSSREIGQLTDQQLAGSSLSHVTIAGGQRCREMPKLSNGHPVYLVEALKSRLGSLQVPPMRAGSPCAQLKLIDLIESTERYEFATLDSATEGLQRLVATEPAVRLASTHVRGLRPDALESAVALLASGPLLEICGPSGIGKSDFIRETFEVLFTTTGRRSPVAAVELVDATSLRALIERLLAMLDQDPGALTDEHTLKDRLLNVDAIVWIQTFTVTSRTVIERLADSLLTAQTRCRLVVENRFDPLFERSSQTITLAGLSAYSLGQILNQVPGGAHEEAALTLLTSSRGNPRLALSQWRSNALETLPDWMAADFAWLDDVFPEPLERSLCSVLTCIVDEAPIELDFFVVQDTACELFPGHIRRSVADALWRVATLLSRQAMLEMKCIFGEEWSMLSDDHIAKKRIWLTSVDAFLAEHERRRSGSAQWSKWRACAGVVIARDYPNRLHASIIGAAWNHDLAPWARSAYRGGLDGVSNLIRWLDGHVIERQSAPLTDRRLERAIRLMSHVDSAIRARHEPPDVDRELGTWTDDGEGAYLATIMRMVIDYYRDKPVAVDLHRLGERRYADTYAEVACWCSRAFSSNVNGREHWWDLLMRLSKGNLSPAVRLLVWQNLLLCAAVRGEQFLSSANANGELRDLCVEMTGLAGLEGSLHYLKTARTFHDFLVGKATVHGDFGSAALKWIARAADKSRDRFHVDQEFMEDLKKL